MSTLARGLIVCGMVLVLAGCALLLAHRAGVPLGRLPGDIFYRGRHGTIYFPIATCLLVSILVSIILSFLYKSRP